jgi:hypothetical protein
MQFIFPGIALIYASDKLPEQNKDIHACFYDMVLQGNSDSVKYPLKKLCFR